MLTVCFPTKTIYIPHLHVLYCPVMWHMRRGNVSINLCLFIKMENQQCQIERKKKAMLICIISPLSVLSGAA